SDPLRSFFATYPSFIYNASAAPTSEFYRLCSFFGWSRGDANREDAYKSFRIALTKQFNTVYGTDAESLESWQLLCAKVGAHPVPNSLKKCREIITNTHVNLVDLVQPGGVVTKFATVDELSAYSRSEGKIFPKEDAYAGGLLKELLRHILSPELDR
ncbi:hypothetical protein CPB84DRAFT_1632391, partial [Gymnopilus junonius]